MPGRIVIVGAGCGGLAVAHQLRRLGISNAMTVIDSSTKHYYQPLWTIVGAGLAKQKDSVKPVYQFMPKNCDFVHDAAAAISGANKTVTTADSGTFEFDYLVVAAGIETQWNRIEGLSETLGKNCVSSNYSFEHCPDTWKFLQNVKDGQRALFTQPPQPLKCAGAPQKIMWLGLDHWQRTGKKVDIHFATTLERMFGVPEYSAYLDKRANEFNVTRHFKHNLVKVDGPNKKAFFQTPDHDELQVIDFDFLHAVPMMGPYSFLKDNSDIVDDTGFVDVDKFTCQSKKFPYIFGVGDCTNLPTAKTAAAVTSQAPVVANNLSQIIKGVKTPTVGKYDGYTSCPIPITRKKLLLAEFAYPSTQATPTPVNTFPWNNRVPNRFNMFLKTHVFPYAYWKYMLYGKWFGKRSFFRPKFYDTDGLYH
eukprot:TRINITY_DN48424_c0_g1_i1.p1 TRINITY_DN48424_c0_g1~~TRINITY_DN48424_c0_g1_i1.p1  ORF type:complete len:436 (+),score=45.52 TRINITY_DN48424_c0_g1_i1:51-1310(+)